MGGGNKMNGYRVSGLQCRTNTSLSTAELFDCPMVPESGDLEVEVKNSIFPGI